MRAPWKNPAACWRPRSCPVSPMPTRLTPASRPWSWPMPARALGTSRHNGPILLIDHCDNCGSGGAQDVMLVVEEILKQNLDDVAIAPIRDPQAVAQMVEAGIGNNVNLKLGGKTDMPAIGLAGRPLQLAGRVRNITDGEIVFTGPMYTGLKSHLGRTAVLDTGRAQIVVTERHHEPFDLVIFRHCGIEPTKKKFIMLKSRIHYPAEIGRA